MPVLLTSELSLEKVNTIIDEKVELAFNPKANIPQEVKDAVNGQSKRVSADFINFIQYHLQNVNSIHFNYQMICGKESYNSAIHQSFLYFSLNKIIGLKCTLQ